VRAAVDTNIFVYAHGLNDARRQRMALDLLERVPGHTVVPAQVLGELFRVLVGKLGRSPGDARSMVDAWRQTLTVQGTAESTIIHAMDLAAGHGLPLWDVVILASAVEAGCTVLLSEDYQDGFSWRGTTVVNPFADASRALLAPLLAP